MLQQVCLRQIFPSYENDWKAGEALDKAGNGINIAEGPFMYNMIPENDRAGYRFM